jgi:hypothetical protein
VSTTRTTGCCSAGRTAAHRTQTRSPSASTGWLTLPACPASGCTTFRYSYTPPPAVARVDTKALSQRVGHASVSFTMETYIHGDIEADREVAHALASVVLAGLPGVDAGEQG